MSDHTLTVVANPLFLHQLFEKRLINEPPLDYLLARLVHEFQGSFCRFADCGAGIGSTSKQYAKVLLENLRPELHHQAGVVCYEPLPENFAKLTENTARAPICRLRMAAVSNAKRIANFNVPMRMKTGTSAWSEGTSYGGFLSDTPFVETIQVQTVRLEDDVEAPLDFVKLDLQGGELEALRGLGSRLHEVSLLYVERQLLKDDGSCAFLRDNGFVVFFDFLQFGLIKGKRDISMRLFDETGIETTRIMLPDGAGMPVVLWGHFKSGKEIVDPETLNLLPAVVEKLKTAGVNYLQTDLICVNSKISHVAEKYLLDLSRPSTSS